VNEKVILTILLVSAFIFPSEAVELEWLSFDDASNQAMEEGKPFLVDFYTDWCHWCKVMDEKTFKEEQVSQILNEDFVLSRIHAEDANSVVNYQGTSFNNVEFTRAMGVRGFPSIAFFDSDGTAITIVPGYVEADVFKHILAYVRDGCYKRKMSFQEFMEKQGDCEDD